MTTLATTNADIRKQRRLIALELLLRAQPEFDPVREIIDTPLFQLSSTLPTTLKTECDRQLGISLSKSESEIMLMIASGRSMSDIAEYRKTDNWTVIHQRKLIMRKFRECYSELAFADDTSPRKRRMRFEQNAFLTIVTYRLLNQAI